MNSKRKSSCPVAAGTGASDKNTRHNNYNIPIDKVQEGYLVVIDEKSGVTALKTVATLKVFQMLVGGYIETVEVIINGKWYVMILDEEGKLKHKRINYIASKLIGAFDYAVGKAIIVKRNGSELIGFSAEEAFMIMGELSKKGGSRV